MKVSLVGFGLCRTQWCWGCLCVFVCVCHKTPRTLQDQLLPDLDIGLLDLFEAHSSIDNVTSAVACPNYPFFEPSKIENFTMKSVTLTVCRTVLQGFIQEIIWTSCLTWIQCSHVYRHWPHHTSNTTGRILCKISYTCLVHTIQMLSNPTHHLPSPLAPRLPTFRPCDPTKTLSVGRIFIRL